MPHYLELTLRTANSWVGIAFCYIVIMGIYYSNAWNVSHTTSSQI